MNCAPNLGRINLKLPRMPPSGDYSGLLRGSILVLFLPAAYSNGRCRLQSALNDFEVVRRGPEEFILQLSEQPSVQALLSSFPPATCPRPALRSASRTYALVLPAHVGLHHRMRAGGRQRDEHVEHLVLAPCSATRYRPGGDPAAAEVVAGARYALPNEHLNSVTSVPIFCHGPSAAKSHAFARVSRPPLVRVVPQVVGLSPYAAAQAPISPII